MLEKNGLPKINMILKNSRPKNSKKIIIISLICVGLLAATGAAAKLTPFWPFHENAVKTAQDPDSKPAPKTAHPSPKNNNVTNKTSTTQPTDQTSNQVPISKNLTAQITELDESNQQIHFAAAISNSPTAGTCVVTFTSPNDRPVTKQFDATTKGTDASCATDVSAYEFSYLGNWQVSFHYYLGDQQTTAEGSINIK